LVDFATIALALAIEGFLLEDLRGGIYLFYLFYFLDNRAGDNSFEPCSINILLNIS